MSGKSRELYNQKRWETPRVTTNGGYSSPQCSGKGSRLEDQVATWPTPQASDGEGGTDYSNRITFTGKRFIKTNNSGEIFSAKLRDAAPKDTLSTSKRLNPRWVEQLMGLPVGGVKLNDSENTIDELRLLGNGVVPQACAMAYFRIDEIKNVIRKYECKQIDLFK